MGYLDNTSVIVDAILTKKGRELLARQDGSFNISQFALSDDEIDYTLYNEAHPNGSAFYGEAIENLPLIEAIPNENNTMISKLVSLSRGTTKIPSIGSVDSPILRVRDDSFTIAPTTSNLDGTENYSFTIADRRLLSNASSAGGGNSEVIPFTGTALSQTFVGATFSATTLAGVTLFGSNGALATSIIIVGLQSGARKTITLRVNKETGDSGTDAVALNSY